MITQGEILMRILLSIVLSGIVGTERERLRRPAGIRTHILVGVGATLVILTSLHLAENFDSVNIDRMGAQVISGIGFLGAGTIIQQGNIVQGLTTAAGLWAVACIGLAVGTGFYFGAIATTIIVLITLILFKEKQLIRDSKYLDISVTVVNENGQIEKILATIEEMQVDLSRIEFLREDNEKEKLITFEMNLELEDFETKNDIINKIISQEGVIRVSKKVGGSF